MLSCILLASGDLGKVRRDLGLIRRDQKLP